MGTDGLSGWCTIWKVGEIGEPGFLCLCVSLRRRLVKPWKTLPMLLLRLRSRSPLLVCLSLRFRWVAGTLWCLRGLFICKCQERAIRDACG